MQKSFEYRHQHKKMMMGLTYETVAVYLVSQLKFDTKHSIDSDKTQKVLNFILQYLNLNKEMRHNK